MPRYYFDFREGDEIAIDKEGLELSTPEQVMEEAARSLADLTKNQLSADHDDHLDCNMSIEVRDEAGPVLQARFTFAIDRLSWAWSRSVN